MLRLAEVEGWDSLNIHVRCPFCLGLHTHDFNGYEDAEFCCSRSCLLHMVRVYKIRFPFSVRTGQVWFEIEKSRGGFVTVGVRSGHKEKETMRLTESASFEDRLQTTNIRENAEEKTRPS